MDLHQLRTFITVAREGSITRSSELLHLSQPAVSAHIKAMEELLGLVLFERTARGMKLTADGERLLPKAVETLAAHQELMDESRRIKGVLRGKLRLGASSNAKKGAVARLLAGLAQRCPEVEVDLRHGTSAEILSGIRSGSLDAGFYNEAAEPEPNLSTTEVSRFQVLLVAPAGLVRAADPPDWRGLAELPWVYPVSSACCGQVAEALFRSHQIRPRRVVSVDREDVTRTLISGGIGLGLLHEDTAEEAQRRGEIDLIYHCPDDVRVRFGHLQSRAEDPLLSVATEIVRG